MAAEVAVFSEDFMVNLALMGAFIPTFFLVSVSPGLCMTMAMTVGMNQGVRRALWMMAGELLGVGLVATAAVCGVAGLMLQFPQWFFYLKCLGALYLLYVAAQMWWAKGSFRLPQAGEGRRLLPRTQLFSQGFVTAVSNPKGWAFHMALLPPFIDPALAFWPQLLVLLFILLTLEFSCLLLYAAGGRVMARFFQNPAKAQWLNRICAVLMAGLALWMVMGD
ncbi:LysE family translocator [Rheinheimera sp.]|uniref:LysE family translocator n=1 Tax=Rheinheimera sp. TaxID=1869214 RepID=UPI00307FC100